MFRKSSLKVHGLKRKGLRPGEQIKVLAGDTNRTTFLKFFFISFTILFFSPPVFLPFEKGVRDREVLSSFSVDSHSIYLHIRKKHEFDRL